MKYFERPFLVILGILAFPFSASPAERPGSPPAVLVNDTRINDDTGTAKQRSPAVAMHPWGPAVVCWIDERLGAYDLYFQLFGKRGQKFGSLGNVRVNDDQTRSVQYYPPSVAMDRNGHFAVAWTAEIGESSFHVYLRRFLANGHAFGGIVRVDDGPEEGIALAPSVACDDSGNTVVVWFDLRQGATGDVFAQLFDPSGRKVGTNVMAHAASDSFQVFPCVAMNGNGDGVVLWEDQRSGTLELYARRFGPGLTARGSGFEVGSELLLSSFMIFRNHDLAVQPDGSFALCWVEGTIPDKNRCRARLYGPTGTALTPVFSLHETGEYSGAAVVRVSPDGFGGYVFAWTGIGLDDANIYTRSCNASGNLGPPAHAVNDIPGVQMYGDMATDANGDKRFAWTDLRNGQHDIYGTVEGGHSPAYLSAGSGFDGMVPITWEPCYGQKEPGTFEIYRSDSQATPFSLVATVNSPDPWNPNVRFDWIDANAANGIQHYYCISMPSGGFAGTSKIVAATPSSSGHALRSAWADGIPVIDGRLSAGEWDDATVLDIASPDAIHQVRLLVKNSGTSIYLAVDDSNDVFVETGTGLGFLVDLDNDGEWDATAPSDEGGVTMTHAGASFHAVWGRYPDHLGAAAPVAAGGIHYLALASSGHVQHEAAIDLSASPLKSSPGETIGFLVWCTDPGNFYAHGYGNPGQWPQGSLPEAVRTFGDLTLAVESAVSGRHAGAPESFWLAQNYPNPFNPETTIRFGVGESCRVTLRVFDVRARELAVLADRRFEAGSHTVRFNASGLPSGLYLIRMEAVDFRSAGKMVVSK